MRELRGKAGSQGLFSELGVMKCTPRCGSGGGDTGATQAQVGSAEC